MSTSASSLQEEASIDEFFNVVATETLALFEHLEFVEESTVGRVLPHFKTKEDDVLVKRVASFRELREYRATARRAK